MSLQETRISLKREYESTTSEIAKLTDYRGRLEHAIRVLDTKNEVLTKTQVNGGLNNSIHWDEKRRAAHSKTMKRAWITRRANARARAKKAK